MSACTHYNRGCDLLSACCGEFFPCRICHDEVKYDNESDVKNAHKMDRHLVQQVRCRECGNVQSKTQRCDNCDQLFGEYFCAICTLYDNDVNKQIYHCQKCGICRVGPQDNFYHCDQCNACLAISLQGNHACREDVLNQSCAICLENLFHSRNAPIVMKCGHYIHEDCQVSMMESGRYSCPICQRSLVDMGRMNEQMDQYIEGVPMPEEYKDMRVNILCNDCNKKNEIAFHFVGLKCPDCGGYNTAQI